MIYTGDCLDILPTLDAESVQCVVTSPPYYGLRDYGTAIWVGGDPGCDHKKVIKPSTEHIKQNGYKDAFRNQSERSNHESEPHYRAVCGKCGATRIDSQIGLEKTPEEYVEKMVRVFREVRRVLRDDGTVWLNLGDSYMAAQGGRQSAAGLMPLSTKRTHGRPTARKDVDVCGWGKRDVTEKVLTTRDCGIKPKDLIGIPWRVALALQADGWWLRQDIIWHKPNPMPESVTDRCTKSHEYIFLLTKSAKYFYDADAVKEPITQSSIDRLSQSNLVNQAGSYRVPRKTNGPMKAVLSGSYSKDSGRNDGNPHPSGGYPPKNGTRNRRSVWTITTKPFKEAHFATFPPEIPEICIKAGSPEKCCPVCGKGWERVVDRGEVKEHPDRLNRTNDAKQFHKDDNQYGDGGSLGRMRVNSTLGFRPACNCGRADSVPGTVLDPFSGAGTTGLVAEKLGRKYIGIELNGEYVKMSEKRIEDGCGRLFKKNEGPTVVVTSTEPAYIPQEVVCPWCDWFGMNDDCRYNACPNCNEKVVLRKEEAYEKEIHR